MEKNFQLSCRICDNQKLDFVYDMGKIAISDFTSKPQKGKKYPITLVYCNSCKLLQLGETTPRDLLYRNYWYESHINGVIRNDLAEIVQEGLRQGQVKKGGIWIDIGANDGTLLSYVPKHILTMGVDPAENLAPQKYSGYWYTGYWENFAATFRAKVITAIACVYDLPNPNLFMANIKNHLDKDGIFICQLMTLAPMIETNDIGNICHEHLEYYSYHSLVTLFERNGLEIFKVTQNDINGGSYRLFARHFKKGSIKIKEKEYGLKDYKKFFTRIEENKLQLQQYLLDLAIDDTPAYGYGASTKGNTILQFYGVNKSMLPGIIDANERKFGKYTVETKIPVLKEIPDKCKYLWILPWGFLENFKEREAEWRKKGGKFIVVSPKFKII